MSAKKMMRLKARVPEWAKDAVWYQIFPERFRNGAFQKSNPELKDFDDRPVKGWAISPWGMDWYACAPWEKSLGGDFYRSVYHRRFGGDLAGVLEKLDYLQDLGVNALYLNPVFMAPSLHKYDASCLHHVDPAFGPDRRGDLALLARANETEDPATWIWTAADRLLLRLVAEVHRRGMRIILDGVFNHTGTRFFAFEDIVKNGQRSRYREWYAITKWNDDGGFEYKGWFNHKGLPELGRTATSLAPPVRDYIFDITRRWMDPDGDGDPSDGVDGWRLDVAFCVPHSFWKSWRKLVKSLNPEAYLTGEIVGPADEFLQGDEFDAVMNYMWLYPTLGFFSPSDRPLGATGLRRALDGLMKRYPRDVNYVQQNLLDSHDTGRILTLLENRCPPFEHWDAYFNYPRARDNAALKTTRPGPQAVRALQQLVLFQMTFVGAPMIYYGTEVGLWGANDPDNRQPMLWADVRHAPERRDPRGPVRPSPRQPDHALFSFFRRAIRLRKAHEALRRGTLRWRPTGDERVLAYDRAAKDERILVLLNTGGKPYRHTLAGPATDLWTGAQVRKGAVIVKPGRWRVLAMD